MSAALKPKPRKTRVTEALAEIIHGANSLEQTRDSLLLLLPELEPEEIKEIRDKAREVGTWAWVVECACDSEMFKRLESKGDDVGVVAAVDKEAYLKGQSRSTIYRNAQIIDTLGKFLIDQKFADLTEKGFYEQALRAPDAEEALEVFAQKKADNPFFSVADARKAVEEIKETRSAARKAFVESIGGEKRKAMANWLHFDAHPTLDALRLRCPDTRCADDILEIIVQLLERHDGLFIEAAEEALLYAWEKGYNTDSLMSEFTFLPVSEVRRVMLNLQTDGYFIKQPQQWKPDQARGGRVSEWVRTDKPMPKITIKPPTEDYRAKPVAA